LITPGPAAQAFLEWSRVINPTDNTDPVNDAVKHFLIAIFPGTHIPPLKANCSAFAPATDFRVYRGSI
jgi:hypothetical protein